jgi:hypothetical protein
VDYILSSNITMRTHTHSDITRNLSDHALLCTHVPLTCPALAHSDFSLFSLDTFTGRRDDDIPHTTTEATTTQPGANTQTPTTPQTSPAIRKKRFTWVGGDNTIEYMNSANKWKAHTSTEKFATRFQQITEEFRHDNERRTERVEEFLVEEAIEAGVVMASETRSAKNPNRWAKHLAPWYTDTCRQAKREYRLAKREHGKKHAKTK